MKIMVRSFALLLIAFGFLTGRAAECVISVNMAGGNKTETLTGPVGGAETYGLEPVVGAFWNNIPYCQRNGISGLKDRLGQVVDDVTFSVNGTINYTTGKPINGGLLYSFVNDDGTPQVSFDGLTAENGFAETCTVIVYMSTDNTNRKFYSPTVNGTRYTYTDGATVAGSTDWGNSNLGAVYSDANFGKTIEGQNCLRITDVVIGDDGRVTVTSGRTDANKHRGGIAAVQIIVDRKPKGAKDLVFSVNFSGNKEGAEECPVSETAGAVPVAAGGWNNIAASVTTGKSGLVWNDGQVRSGVTLDATTKANWHTQQNKSGSNLFYNYLDDTDVSVTINGLTAENGFPATCTVYVYLSCDSQPRAFYPPFVNGTQYTYSDGGAVPGTTTWGDSNAALAGTPIEGKDYLMIPNVAIDAGVVKIVSGRYSKYGDKDRGGIAAVQLVFEGFANDQRDPIVGVIGADNTVSGATWTPAKDDPAWTTAAARTVYLIVGGTDARTVAIDESLTAQKLMPIGSGDLTLSWTEGSLANVGDLDFTYHTGVQRLTTAEKGLSVTAGSETVLPTGGEADVLVPAGACATLDDTVWAGVIDNSQGGKVMVCGESSYEFTTASSGKIELAAEATLILNTRNGNKQYTVEGVDGSSVLRLGSERNWGVNTGSVFNKLRLVTPADREFWVQYASVLNYSVDLELNNTLHMGGDSDNYHVGRLFGSGHLTAISPLKTVYVSLARGDCTFNGTIEGATLFLDVTGVGKKMTLSGTHAVPMTVNGPSLAFSGEGSTSGEVRVGGKGSLILETSAAKAAGAVVVNEGSLVVGSAANTTVDSVTFGYSGNVVRAVIDAETGKTGCLHVTGTVDLTGVSGACDQLSDTVRNVCLMTAAGGFANVDTTRDASNRQLYVGTRNGQPALFYGKKNGLVVILR